MKAEAFKLGFVPFQSLPEILTNVKISTIPKKGIGYIYEICKNFYGVNDYFFIDSHSGQLCFCG